MKFRNPETGKVFDNISVQEVFGDGGEAMKPCYGKCDRCVWKYNNGCSEWNGYGKGDQHDN